MSVACSVFEDSIIILPSIVIALKEPIRLYHYTNTVGKDGIYKDRRIIRSSKSYKDDAVCGAGVYLTAVRPAGHTKAEILENNYGAVPPGGEDLVDFFYRFELEELRRNGTTVEKCNLSGRNVWIYRDREIPLCKVQGHDPPSESPCNCSRIHFSLIKVN